MEDHQPTKKQRVRRPKLVNHRLIGDKDASLCIMDKACESDKHMNIAHVAQDWWKLIRENYVCLMIQRKGVNELRKVYMSRAEGVLKVNSSQVNERLFDSAEAVVVGCLDEFLLVKGGSYLYVVDQVKNKECLLPKTSKTCLNFENSVFCLLHDNKKGNDGRYKVVHIWGQTTRKKDRAGNLSGPVGCETLVIKDGFEYAYDSHWNTIPVPSDLKNWRIYLKEFVTVGSKLVFWDVRSENYLVKFDIKTLEFIKIQHPRHQYVGDMEKRRFLFEDRDQLLVFYAGEKDAAIYMLEEDLTWGFVKKVSHLENWERRDTESPFPVSSVLVKRFILFEKEKNQEVWCYDLKDEVSKQLEGITFANTYKGIAQSYSFSGRLIMGTPTTMHEMRQQELRERRQQGKLAGSK